MGFLDQLKEVFSAAQEVPEKKKSPYYPQGFHPQAYRLNPKNYEAVQLQNTGKSVGNLPEVLAFLVQKHVEFAVCKHGELYVWTQEGLEKLEDGEWIVTTDFEDRVAVAAYGGHFMDDYTLKGADLEEEKAVRENGGITVDVEEMNRVSETAVDSPQKSSAWNRDLDDDYEYGL